MNRIFYILLIFTVVLVISCSRGSNDNRGNRPSNATNEVPTTATPTPTPANDEADVKKLVSDFAAALSRNDADALDKIYSDGYVLITGSGEITTKPERMTAIKSGDLKFEKVAFEEVSVRAYGNSAVVIAKALGSATSKGKTQNAEERVTLVAAKETDGWRLVSAQITPITVQSASTNTKYARPVANTAPAANGANGNK